MQSSIYPARAVVTGGGGFLGAHLTRALLDAGSDVVVLDPKPPMKLEAALSAAQCKRLTYVAGTLNDAAAVEGAFCGANVVFHLAGGSNPADSIQAPIEAHHANATSTLLALEAARSHGVERFIYASSSAVYGEAKGGHAPLGEASPVAPATPYAASKLAGETYCNAYHKCYGLSTLSLRLFNVYGVTLDHRLPSFGVIARFVRDAMAGAPLTVFGDGSATRDFVYVSDVLRAFIMLADSEAIGVVNIAGSSSISMRQLATMVLEIGGSASSIQYLPERTGEVGRSSADITRARTHGWEPAVGIKEGLTDTLDALKRHSRPTQSP